MPARAAEIRRFDLPAGYLLAGKYVIEDRIGGGWEGEVFRVVERRTGIRRAAKLFYPIRNPGDRAAKRYARKLERLRGCPIVAQYHHSETIEFAGRRATCLLSELFEGEVLSSLLARRPGNRMEVFEALHFLYVLADGLDCIHRAGEYHGDLHAGNALVRLVGVRFEIKLFDFFHRGRGSREAMQVDVMDAVRLFYDALGGRRTYAGHPQVVKTICCGLKHGLLRRRFPTARRLVRHLERFAW